MSLGGDHDGPYTLQPLLYPALPQDASIKPHSPAAVSLAVRCAEGHGNNLYVGSSNGIIHHYVRSDEGSSSNPDNFALVSSKTISQAGKPIERLLVLSRIGVAAVVCESTLSWLHLPSLDALPANLLPVVRGVSTAVLDDAEVDEGGIDGEGFVSFCVIKRKQAILAKVGMGRWITVKEVPLPNGIVLARRRGDALCVASTSEYSLVNLTTNQVVPLGLPISQSSEAPSASTRPSILSFRSSGQQQQQGDCEFLITSHSSDQTLGVFVQASGDPAAKLIEWQSHPRAINLDYPHLVSLLRDDSIQVHDLETMQNVQTIQLPDLLEPRLLSSGQSVLEVSSAEFSFEQHLTDIDLSTLRRASPSADPFRVAFRDFGPIQRHPVWSSMILHSTPRKTTLIMTCKNAVQCLCEPVALAEAVPLLRRGRWDSLQRLVDVKWESREVARIAADAPQTPPHLRDGALEYLYSLLTLRHLHMLDFYAATSTFARSSLDARVVLRLFPDLWASDKSESPSIVRLFSPLCNVLQDWPSADELVKSNLAWNYGTSGEGDEDVNALHQQLMNRAYDMIESILESTRTVSVGSRSSDAVRVIVDTALARLFIRKASNGQNRQGVEKLSSFLRARNACDPAEIADAVKTAGASPALAELYLQRQAYDETLEIWTGLIDKDQSSGGVDFERGPRRGVADVVRLLDECERPDLRQKYAFWVVKHDAAAGVKLLSSTTLSGQDLSTSLDPSTQQRDSRDILRDLRAAGADEAASQFLEQTVLSSKEQVTELHEELLRVLLKRLLSALDDDATRSRILSATQDYIAGGYAEAFVGHLALQIQYENGGSSGVSRTIQDRLKLVMLLQGSQVISVGAVLNEIETACERWSGASSLLAYEKAILLGKLHREDEALRILALELHDVNSAEAFCLQGGVVLSPFIAGQVASAIALDESDTAVMQMYAKLISRGTRTTIKKTSRQGKDRLLKSLLSIYMNASDGSDGDAAEGGYNYQTATAHLLNTQALHLSALEILPLVPSHWPLKTLETFLTRNLRRESEQRHKGLIQRHVELSRSLEASEQSWLLARSLGGVLQEGDEGGDGRAGNDEGGIDAETKRDIIGNVVNAFAGGEKRPNEHTRDEEKVIDGARITVEDMQ